MSDRIVRPAVAIAAVVLDGDRVLQVRRGRPPDAGLWSVPGGRLENGEALADAVRREVREETQIEIEVGPLVAVVERVPATGDDSVHYVILDYLGYPCSPDAVPIGGDDVTEARWVGRDELAELALTAGLVEVIDRARGFRVAKAMTTR